jgi:hypothetical protein
VVAMTIEKSIQSSPITIAHLLCIRVSKNMTLTKTSALAVSIKILIAILGGYAFTSGYVAFLSIMLAELGIEAGEALMLSAMTGFLVYLCVTLWMFTTQKIWRTSIIIILMAVVMITVSPYLAENF